MLALPTRYSITDCQAVFLVCSTFASGCRLIDQLLAESAKYTILIGRDVIILTPTKDRLRPAKLIDELKKQVGQSGNSSRSAKKQYVEKTPEKEIRGQVDPPLHRFAKRK